MKIKKNSFSYIILVFVLILVLSSCSKSSIDDQVNSTIINNKETEAIITQSPEPTNSETPNVTNSNTKEPDNKTTYLGQEVPGDTPKLFLPDIVSTDNFEHSSPTISLDGSEIYWSRIEHPLSQDAKHKIVYSKRVDNQWSEPKIASFSGINSDDGPRFNQDYSRIYFHSKITSSENSDYHYDIFYTEKIDDGWSIPKKLEGEINTEEIESDPSFTSDGTLVFCRHNKEASKDEFLFTMTTNESYNSPEKIYNETENNFINVNPFINKEGDILLFGSVNRSDGFGACDLYVSFLTEDNGWSEPINLGDSINTRANERFPSLSPDGKYLFFVSNRASGIGDVYWVDASVIYELKPN